MKSNRKKQRIKPLCYKKTDNDFYNKYDEFVDNWNNIFPFDYYYRDKYNIPIFSKKHLKISLFSELCWYRETLKMNKIKEDNDLDKRKEKREKEIADALLNRGV